MVRKHACEIYNVILENIATIETIAANLAAKAMIDALRDKLATLILALPRFVSRAAKKPVTQAPKTAANKEPVRMGFGIVLEMDRHRRHVWARSNQSPKCATQPITTATVAWMKTWTARVIRAEHGSATPAAMSLARTKNAKI